MQVRVRVISSQTRLTACVIYLSVVQTHITDRDIQATGGGSY